MSEPAELSDGIRRPGRPRKWTDDAERARAYRARRAEELAEPEKLREDRRRLQRRVRDLTTQLEAEHRRRTDIEREPAAARADVDRLSRSLLSDRPDRDGGVVPGEHVGA